MAARVRANPWLCGSSTLRLETDLGQSSLVMKLGAWKSVELQQESNQ
jgi:hypothetical protein